ncbi:SH3 domain-binding protein 5-like [Sycon ciliatum]|uniref:SH3 domain-binding protein 5-like n=1 Tax=Sycon ciliatum TaxID=27933 RepID=UPI0031F610BE
MSTTQEEAESVPKPDDVLDQPREAMPSPDGQEEDDEELDPRVKDELDRLNTASENINKYEKAIGDAREKFKAITDEAFRILNGIKKSREKSIAKARPYFELRKRARRAHIDAQRSAQRYEKMSSMHKAARETVAKAEANVMAGKSDQVATGIVGQDSMAWMEVLNHATLKVMESEKERRRCEEEHLTASDHYSQFEKRIHVLYKDNKRSIKNAMPYFEQHAKYYLQLESVKKSIEKLDKSIADAKAQYSSALSSLERISNEIHQSRDRNVSQKAAREAIEGASATPSTGPPGERTDGVGAEVNVDAVLAEMTNLTFQYTESLGSLDDVDDDRPDGMCTPTVLDRLDKLDIDETSSLATSTSQDPDNQVESLSSDGTAAVNGVHDGYDDSVSLTRERSVEEKTSSSEEQSTEEHGAGTNEVDRSEGAADVEVVASDSMLDTDHSLHGTEQTDLEQASAPSLADELRMAGGADGDESAEDA